MSVRLSRPGFSLEVDGEFPVRGVTARFGRSGCGKTTLLRCIAGLDRVAAARVHFNGKIWQDGGYFLPTHRRSVGYVFQEPSLFPHHDVRGNLQYGLQRVPPALRRIGFDETVRLLGLEALLEHRPEQLSGGQRQRVAIARALLASPQLLLMDEPLTSLDETSKAEILPHLERLHDALSIPVIYVSHALGEVMRLADDLVLLEAGQVRAAGPLQQLLTRTDLPLGHLGDGGTVIEGVIDAHDPGYHLSFVMISGGRLALSMQTLPIGHRVRVRIDARDVSLALEPPQRSSITNILRATALELRTDGDPAQVLVRLQVGDDLMLARVTRRSAVQLGLAAGTPLYVQIKSVALTER
ncbi:MAG: molybdenum ABC transporter ATP-binding protein [Steroidobacteraceae bacterium]